VVVAPAVALGVVLGTVVRVGVGFAVVVTEGDILVEGGAVVEVVGVPVTPGDVVIPGEGVGLAAGESA
jgi:hypothetical protein